MGRLQRSSEINKSEVIGSRPQTVLQTFAFLLSSQRHVGSPQLPGWPNTWAIKVWGPPSSADPSDLSLEFSFPRASLLTNQFLPRKESFLSRSSKGICASLWGVEIFHTGKVGEQPSWRERVDTGRGGKGAGSGSAWREVVWGGRRPRKAVYLGRGGGREPLGLRSWLPWGTRSWTASCTPRAPRTRTRTPTLPPPREGAAGGPAAGAAPRPPRRRRPGRPRPSRAAGS